jgi:hypothetical protein
MVETRDSMRILRLSLPLLLAALCSSSALAVDQTLEHWLNLNATGRFQAVGEAKPSPAVWYLEFQPRFQIWEPKPLELLMRPAVGWEIWPNVIVLGGFAAVPAYAAPEWQITGTRFWQQVGVVHSVESFTFSGRGRAEERLFSEKDPALRARLMARAAWRLPIAEDKLSLFVSDEVFLNFADEVFDQNRLSLGVNWRFATWLSVEGGYLNVIKNNPFEAEDAQLRHVLAVTTTINLL